MALRAPLAVSVEIRATDIGAKADREVKRVFRLSRLMGEDGIRLERPAPFEIARPVEVRFRLPGDDRAIVVTARVDLADGDTGDDGGRELAFGELPSDARERVARYVSERLQLPTAI